MGNLIFANILPREIARDKKTARSFYQCYNFQEDKQWSTKYDTDS